MTCVCADLLLICHRQIQANIQTAVHALNGLDVYWDGPVESVSIGAKGTVRQRTTKRSSSGTGFGKAYMLPFPFTVVLVFDDSDDEVFFSLSPVVAGVRRDAQQSLAEFYRFIQVNFSPEIQRRKLIRLSLRSMNGMMGMS